MNFHYFDNPRSFSYMAEQGASCHFCSSTSDCLDAEMFFGVEEISAICFSCMQSGKLIDLDISTNDIRSEDLNTLKGDADKVSNDLIYCTPGLPTWQDHFWPVVDGKPAKFIKISSKPDYKDKKEFIESLYGCLESDTDWLWSILPDHKVTNLKNGQFSISFYLFDIDGSKLTLIDAN